MKAPFPFDPVRTAIVIAYRNKRLIADDVLPRVTVGKSEYKWNQHNLAESFTVPDTAVGRRSAPNEVTFTATEKTGSTKDYGLDDPIPHDDIVQAPENHDVLSISAEELMNLILLDREIRTSTKVFDAANYAAANKKTLGAGAKWNDFENSDPVEELTNALDAVIMRPTAMTIGRKAFSTLMRHPKILKSVHGNSGDSGIATRQQIADLFELEKINIGEAYLNTAKKGQTASLARAWGNHCLLSYHENVSSTQRGTTFGFTAQFGTRMSGAEPDSKIGAKGGMRNRVVESVQEQISAADLAFFLQSVID